VNIKKGQFLAPHDMKNVIEKARAAAREKGLPEDSFMACERGVSFGYNNLVSDMRSLAIMRETGAPVVFDATHSVQLPGGQGTSSGGQREFVPVLSRAAVAVGVAGLFMETHPDPANAMSDGPNAVPLKHMKALLEQLLALDRVVKQQPLLENDFSAEDRHERPAPSSSSRCTSMRPRAPTSRSTWPRPRWRPRVEHQGHAGRRGTSCAAAATRRWKATGSRSAWRCCASQATMAAKAFYDDRRPNPRAQGA
jgi:hypothetical protein